MFALKTIGAKWDSGDSNPHRNDQMDEFKGELRDEFRIQFKDEFLIECREELGIECKDELKDDRFWFTI